MDTCSARTEAGAETVRYYDGQKCYSHQQSLCAAISVWHHPNRSEEVARSAGNGEVLPDPATVVL